MFRQLLTLLAVIFGLTLSSAPAQASPASVVSAVQMADRGECVVQGARPMQLAQTDAAGPALRRPFARMVAVVHVPAVLLQADRAHE